MKSQLQTEVLGMEICEEEWDEASQIARLEWALRSAAPPLSMRLLAHLPFNLLPPRTQAQLFDAWLEVQ